MRALGDGLGLTEYLGTSVVRVSQTSGSCPGSKILAIAGGRGEGGSGAQTWSRFLHRHLVATGDNPVGERSASHVSIRRQGNLSVKHSYL